MSRKSRKRNRRRGGKSTRQAPVSETPAAIDAPVATDTHHPSDGHDASAVSEVSEVAEESNASDDSQRAVLANHPEPAIDACEAVEAASETGSPNPAETSTVDPRPSDTDETEVLWQLVDEIRQLRGMVQDARFGRQTIDGESASGDLSAEFDAPHSPAIDSDAGDEEWKERVDALTEQNRQLEEQAAQLSIQNQQLAADNDELSSQNNDLASQVAGQHIRQSICPAGSDPSSTDTGEALSWEQRKELIFQQMEDDSFDSEAFVQSIAPRLDSDEETQLGPAQIVDHLFDRVDQVNETLRQRDDEIHELRCMLEQRNETEPEDSVAVGAAAIAQMMDQDELICEERARLQQLQADWEEKFRQVEIDASLERAKLARERQELARQNAELEEQLTHLRRENRQADEAGEGKKRRWLAELGL